MSSESPPTLESAESEKVLDILRHNAGTANKTRKAVRNHTLALLMLEAGLRVGELVQLRKSSLWFNSQPVKSILVPARITHSSKERYVPLTERLSDAVKSMQLNHWSMFASSADHPAFYSGQPNQPLSERQVQRIINCA